MMDMQWENYAEFNKLSKERRKLISQKASEEEYEHRGLTKKQVDEKTTNLRTYFGDLMVNMLPGFSDQLGEGATPRIKRHK